MDPLNLLILTVAIITAIYGLYSCFKQCKHKDSLPDDNYCVDCGKQLKEVQK